MKKPANNRVLVSALFALLIVVVVSFVVREELELWAEQLAQTPGLIGPAILLTLFVLAALLLLPGSALTLTAGALFGLIGGTALASLGTVISAALSYGLMRTRLAAPIESYLNRSPRRIALYQAVQDGDWRLLGLMRLSPALPLGLSNYVFALVKMRFAPYLFVTWLATLPSKLLWAHIGATGREGLASLQTPAAVDPWELAYGALALVATVAAVGLLGRLAGRRLEQLTQLSSASSASSSTSASR